MPEIKQNFISGKMNKDLDERLIQKGEYREAQNIHITESEGSDVGAIENILGTSTLTDSIAKASLPGSGYSVIGYCRDLTKKRIIYFVTNFTNTSFTDNIRNIERAQGAGTGDYSASTQHGCAIMMYDIEGATKSYVLVSGAWLNFSKNHLITGVQIIEDLLFWTDDLNQPRKINIQTALEEGLSYYDCEQTISVAKYAPYCPPLLYEDDQYGTSGLSRDVVDETPSDYMKERFVRFAYRYKYDDGEYSLISPFTQSVFEPLNGGIITNSETDDEKNETTGEPEVLTGKKEVYKKGTVDIMQNRINTVNLRIPLPNKNEFTKSNYSSSYSNPYHISEIDVILKESNGISFKLIKTIKVSEIQSSDIEEYQFMSRSDLSGTYKRQFLKYTYYSSKPYKTLPESEVTRVYDQVPILAKAMDVVGNRVVFGNYVENYPYPIDFNGNKGLNYTVGSTTKGAVDTAGATSSAPYLYGAKQWLHTTQKYSTVKQRRTYQVGIVLADIYGRQSPVILSSNTTNPNADTVTVAAVTSKHNNTNGSWDSSIETFGKSLTIGFVDGLLTNDSKFVANLQYGELYNPHGWYSYRIVVKQTEQDYYNVYTSHPFDGWNNISEEPENTLTGGRSWISLHGDNINKVPRSLNNNDLNRPGTMGSDIRLYPKVIFEARQGGIRKGEIEDVDGLVTQDAGGIASGTYTINIGQTSTSGVTYTGDGDGATITIETTGSADESIITVTSVGSGFKVGETITIDDTVLTNATQDVILTLRIKDLYDTVATSKINSNNQELLDVISLGTAFEQNLFLSGDDNKSGTGGFSVYDFIYGKNKNPLMAEIRNMKAYTGSNSNNASAVYFVNTVHSSDNDEWKLFTDQKGTTLEMSDYQFNGYSVNVSGLTGDKEVLVTATNTANDFILLSSDQALTQYDKVVLSKNYEGLTVFETEPFESKIDIYYETSTCGLIADLVEEVDVDPALLPSDLRIDQSSYTGSPFSVDQPAATSSQSQGGYIAFLYENFASGVDIGDISATSNTSTPDNELDFAINKVVRVADQKIFTSSFTLFDTDTSGNPNVHDYVLRTSGTFIFRNNNYDDFLITIAVTDTDGSSGTAYLKILVRVKNSVPTITVPSAPATLLSTAGSGAIVINTNNTITNGSLVASGTPNNTNGLTVTFDFGNSDFNEYFDVEVNEGEYIFKTTTEWTEENANDFFDASTSDRLVTFTVTDEHGLTAEDSIRIDESGLVVKSGKLIWAGSSSIYCSNNSGTDYYATTGTSSTDPALIGDWLDLSVGNLVYTDATLQTEVSAANYISNQTLADGDFYAIDSSGAVTSVTAFDRLDCP